MVNVEVHLGNAHHLESHSCTFKGSKCKGGAQLRVGAKLPSQPSMGFPHPRHGAFRAPTILATQRVSTHFLVGGCTNGCVGSVLQSAIGIQARLPHTSMPRPSPQLINYRFETLTLALVLCHSGTSVGA